MIERTMSLSNVLFIVLDSARYDHLSLNGYHRTTTPNLDDLSSDSIVFDQAFSAAPWTPPSHASMFTGTYPSVHGYFDAGMNVDMLTLAEHLSMEGYATFGTVVNPKIGDQTALSRGFDEYLSVYRIPFKPQSIKELRQYYVDLLPGFIRLARKYPRMDRKASEYLTNHAIKTRISSNSGSQPFFGFININAPHSKYAPPQPFRDRFETFDENDIRMDLVRDMADRGGYKFMAEEINPTSDEWNAVKDWYDGEIAFADSLIGELVQSLRKEGVYEDTMIIVTGDHGEHFGEHGRAYHQFSLFDELIHVPLLVKLPSQKHGGARRKDLVSHVDIAPTVYNQMNITAPNSIEGKPLFDDENREAIFAEYGEPITGVKSLESNSENPVQDHIYDRLNHGLQCVRTKEFKLIRRSDDELIVTGVTDGEEVLSKQSLDQKGRQSIDELRERLNVALPHHPNMSNRGEIAEGTKQRLKELGYL